MQTTIALYRHITDLGALSGSKDGDRESASPFVGLFSVRRDKRPVWLVALSLGATLYLITALIIPGSFLIARGVASTVYGSTLVDHSQAQFSHSTDESDNTIPSSGPKRLRGALDPNVGVDKIFGSFAALEASWFQIDAASNPRPILTEPEPKATSLPQELLRRPPPSK